MLLCPVYSDPDVIHWDKKVNQRPLSLLGWYHVQGRLCAEQTALLTRMFPSLKYLMSFPCFFVTKAVVLGLWITASSGGGQMSLSQEVTLDYRKTHIFTLQFIDVTKLPLGNRNENNLMVWGHYNMKSCIKGSQHQEIPCFRFTYIFSSLCVFYKCVKRCTVTVSSGKQRCTTAK